MKTIRALEVIPVHVLDRSHLAHAAAIAAACAALTLVLTLLLADPLSDFGSASPFGWPAAPPTTVRSIKPGWNLNPFTRLLRAPAPIPWSA